MIRQLPSWSKSPSRKSKKTQKMAPDQTVVGKGGEDRSRRSFLKPVWSEISPLLHSSLPPPPHTPPNEQLEQFFQVPASTFLYLGLANAMCILTGAPLQRENVLKLGPDNLDPNQDTLGRERDSVNSCQNNRCKLGVSWQPGTQV